MEYITVKEGGILYIQSLEEMDSKYRHIFLDIDIFVKIILKHGKKQKNYVVNSSAVVI